MSFPEFWNFEIQLFDFCLKTVQKVFKFRAVKMENCLIYVFCCSKRKAEKTVFEQTQIKQMHMNKILVELQER